MLQDAINLQRRRAPIYSDDLQLYKARIFKNMSKEDNRLQVRPLPFLADVTETDYLPIFSPLIKGNVVRGFTEKDDGPLKADNVLIVATPDFHYGFVLSLLNKFEGNDDSFKMSHSYRFDVLKDYMDRKRILPSDFEYEDIVVQHWTEAFDDDGETTGGIMEFYNFRTGDKFIILTTGTIFALTGDKILLRVGAGDSDPLGGKKFSAVEMTPEKIYFNGPLFQVDCEVVRLGNNALKVLGTNAGLIPVAVDGQPIIASKNVYF